MVALHEFHSLCQPRWFWECTHTNIILGTRQTHVDEAVCYSWISYCLSSTTRSVGRKGGGKSYYSLSYAPIPINMAVLIKGKLSQVFYFHNITPRWKQENYAALQTAFSHKHWGKSLWAHKHSEEHCLQQWYPYTPRSMGRHTYYLLHWDNADAIYLAGNAEAFTENWQKRKTQRIQTR